MVGRWQNQRVEILRPAAVSEGGTVAKPSKWEKHKLKLAKMHKQLYKYTCKIFRGCARASPRLDFA